MHDSSGEYLPCKWESLNSHPSTAKDTNRQTKNQKPKPTNLPTNQLKKLGREKVLLEGGADAEGSSAWITGCKAPGPGAGLVPKRLCPLCCFLWISRGLHSRACAEQSGGIANFILQPQDAAWGWVPPVQSRGLQALRPVCKRNIPFLKCWDSILTLMQDSQKRWPVVKRREAGSRGQWSSI
jgi:hypothetical protein